jgi:hypothetical protein
MEGVSADLTVLVAIEQTYQSRMSQIGAETNMGIETALL